MNWNIFFAVAICLVSVVVAGLAGQLAATKPWHKWVFWGAAVVTIGLVFFQAKFSEDSQAKNAERQQRWQDQITSKLDEIAKMPTSSAKRQAATDLKREISCAPYQLARLKNNDIRQCVLDFVFKIRRLADDIEAYSTKSFEEYQREIHGKTEEEKTQLFHARGNRDEAFIRSEMRDYDQKYKIDAMLVRDALLEKLPPGSRNSSVDYERPTNPIGLKMVADDLERLAKILP